MRLVFYSLFLCTACGPTYHAPDDDAAMHTIMLPIIPDDKADLKATSAKVFYLIQTGHTEEAITALLEAKKNDPYLLHDATLEKLGLQIMEQGTASSDWQDIATSLIGSRIAQDERTLPIVEAAVKYNDMQMQLLAVSVAASFDTIQAQAILEQAMKSNFLIVRLEAAFWLATKRAPNASMQIAALMSKVDPELHEHFCKLFAIDGSAHSIKELKRLLFHQDPTVRREAILAVAELERDDFLQEIHNLANEPSTAQQEACAYAMGNLGCESSRQILQRLARSNSMDVRLASSLALYQLGDDSARGYIIEEAKRKNCFAIMLLGSFPDCASLLASFHNDPDINVRVNSALALLALKDRRALAGLDDILIDSPTDFAYQISYSHGRSLIAWKATPSSQQNLAKNPYFFELSLALREQVLASCLELSEDDFIEIAQAIFESGQLDLIPLTVRLLENLRSEKAIRLLQNEQQRLGAPTTRAWCTLALYRMQVDGPYKEAMQHFVEKHEDKNVFQLRPVLPWRMRPEETKYEISLEESYALLIESFEALALRQDEKGIEQLLIVIRDGNVHNRYALAGLLMRSAS